MPKIYLDHSATTPVDGAVLEAMLPYFREKFGNASSIHQFGQETRNIIEQARERIAHFIHAKESEIIFLSGGTEADNYALKGVAGASKKKGNHIITSAYEHPAILNTAKFLGKNKFSITYLKPDRFGIIHPEMVEEAITSKTILVSIMHVNNEIGTKNSIEKIGKITKEKGICFHTDAVQSFGKIPINVKEMNIDLLSASAHKIYGPKGIGFIYIRDGVELEKFIHGGSHERNRRAGTENVPSIVGFHKAVEICEKVMEEQAERISSLQEYLWNKIHFSIPNVVQNGHPTERIPGILNVSFRGVEGESLLVSLDMKGIAVSSGSACTSGSSEPSHVLDAISLAPELKNSTLRFSLGRSNTEEDIDITIQVLVEVVERLRAMAPNF